MARPSLGIQLNPSDETIRPGLLTVRFLLTAEDSGGSVAAFELTVPPVGRLPVPAHSHDQFEETVYGLDGTMTWTVDGKPIDVGPGEMLCIRRGAVHRFDNNGGGAVRALCVITPGVLGPAYFREIAEVLNAPAAGPPDHARLADIMLRHGLRPAPPQA
jgi:quercetin dioxygenase-like cupin family protein